MEAEVSIVRADRGARAALLALALLAVGAGPAAAQGWPFMFTVTTEPAGSDTNWTAHYEGGYADRAPDPFAFDGMEHRLGIQGRRRHGLRRADPLRDAERPLEPGRPPARGGRQRLHDAVRRAYSF